MEKNWRQAYNERRAEDYDRLMPLLTMNHAGALEAVIHMVSASPSRELKILELGPGTGLLTQKILDRFVLARIHGLDGSEEMLAVARQKLNSYGARVTWQQGSFEDVPQMAFPEADFDLIVSAFSLHHLDHRYVPVLFTEFFRILAPGGQAVIADYVATPYNRLQRHYEDLWVEARWRNLQKEGGALPTKEEVWADHEAMKKAEGDNPAPLGSLLAWMERAGFGEVECHWKHFCYAVYGGVKPAAPGLGGCY